MAEPRGGLGHLLIGQPSLSSTVARALATKGDQPQYIEGRYNLGITALDLTQPEYRWLRRHTTWESHIAQAAVAAQFGYAQLGYLQASLGRISIICESVLLSNTSAGRLGYFISLGFNALGIATGPFSGHPVDDRMYDAAGAAASAAFVGGGTNAAPGVTAQQSRFVSLASGASLEVFGPWIVTGKVTPTTASSLTIVADTVNVSVQVSFRWRERELLASEA